MASKLRKMPKAELIPADALFIQLCGDLNLARGVGDRVRAGLLPRHHLYEAKALERGSFRAIAQYMSAVAWTIPNKYR